MTGDSLQKNKICILDINVAICMHALRWLLKSLHALYIIDTSYNHYKKYGYYSQQHHFSITAIDVKVDI